MPQGAVNTGIAGTGVRMPAPPRRALEGIAFALACATTVWSAATVKQAVRVPPLVAVQRGRTTTPDQASSPESRNIDGDSAKPSSLDLTAGTATEPGDEVDDATTSPPPDPPAVPTSDAPPPTPGTRWFNGRPIRPAHVMWMTVTAYTPGPESCWPSDDGITATLHCVTTNAGALVAADTDVLPFGSLVSIEGYDASSVVPVLDRGGKIRGRRLDVLMPTVEEARAWGVRRVPVVVWEYADGQMLTDPRRVR